MSRTIVSWARFCEWVQGKLVVDEVDEGRATILYFADGTKAAFYSDFDMRFGEKTLEPPLVEIEEKAL